MNRKQFLSLLVLVAVVGAAGWIVRQRHQGSWQSAGQAIGAKLLPGLPLNDIAHITLRAGSNEVNLVRRDQGWSVRERHDYPAGFSGISDLLLKLADLKVVQTEEVVASQLGRFELLPPGTGAGGGTQVEFRDQSGRSCGSLLLGKKHRSRPRGGPSGSPDEEGWPDGRYVLAGAGSNRVVVISDPLEDVQPEPAAWLKKDFLHIERPRLISLEFAEATNSWKLTRVSETNDWQLAGALAGEKLDPDKLSGVTSPLGSASFQDVAALPATPATNAATLRVETFDGFTYVASIGAVENGTCPVSFAISANLAAERVAAAGEKAEDKEKLDQEFKGQQSKLNEKLAREKSFAGWVYHLPSYTVDSLLRHRRDLLAETGKETGKETVDKAGP